jgi:hypothetical protein
MNLIVEKFLETKEGRDFVKGFSKKFEGYFAHINMSPNILYECEKSGKTYALPEWETIEGFKQAIGESLKQGRDLLISRYKDHEIKFDPNALY